MNFKFGKKIFLLLILLNLQFCAHKEENDGLILPPNFSEMPDVNHPEQPTEQQKDADIDKLKDLLLKSE